MRPNARSRALRPSITLALDARAKELAAGGADVVNMTVGEPDSPAPPAVQKAAVAKVQSGDVRYTPASGTASLRKAIAKHVESTRGVAVAPEEIVVCHSAKHALSGALTCLIEPGDEVLCLLPSWVSYQEIVRICGGVPVDVPSRPDMGPDLAAIARAIGPKTRGILVNSPCNPTGYVMSPEEVRALAELAQKRDLWMVSDEIYRRMVHEGAPNPSPLSVSADARARTVVVDGASKAFAMTGYRIGFACAPRELASAIGALHSQMTGSPNAVSQSAYEAGLVSEPPEVQKMCDEFRARRDLVVAGLASIGLPMERPRGAYYAFPNVSAYLDERGSTGFCEDLLESERLAIVPGSAFGVDTHVRLSYAVDRKTIERALERLGRFLAARRPRSATPARRA